MNRITHLVNLVLISVLALNGCSSGEDNAPKAQSDTPIKVTVQKIESFQDSANVHSYIGTIEESSSIPLSFLITGTVEKVWVVEGEHVNKGQLLAIVNNESYKNAYEAALATQKQAEDAFERLDPVYKKGSLPEVKYVELQTGLKQSTAIASIAEKNMNDTKLYAPSAGVIGRRMIEPGMSALPGSPVFNLVNIKKVKVSFPVPENEISLMKTGQKTVVQVAALGYQKFEGKVSEIGVLSNPVSHTYTVKVELDNSDETLKPGMVCQVSVSSVDSSNRIIVPMSAVQLDGNGNKYVFIADKNSNRVQKKNVSVGNLASRGVIIEKGLAPGDLVITKGYQKINQNSTIQIVQ